MNPTYKLALSTMYHTLMTGIFLRLSLPPIHELGHITYTTLFKVPLYAYDLYGTNAHIIVPTSCISVPLLLSGILYTPLLAFIWFSLTRYKFPLIWVLFATAIFSASYNDISQALVLYQTL